LPYDKPFPSVVEVLVKEICRKEVLSQGILSQMVFVSAAVLLHHGFFSWGGVFFA